jgi:hypothetical protein
MRKQLKTSKRSPTCSLYLNKPPDKKTSWGAYDASANYNMDCLRSHSTCSIGSGGQIVVKDSEGNLVYDPTLGNSGITKSGVNCNAPFSSSCPIQLSLNWAPDCTLPCAPTKVIINGQFFVDSQLIVNTQVYDFQFSQNVP